MDEVAAMPALPDTSFGNDVCWSGQNRSGDATEDFVEGYVDSIEQCGNFGVFAVIKWPGFPEPRSVHVGGYATSARPIDDRVQGFPGGQLAANFTLWQFQQQGSYRFDDRIQVFESKEPVGRARQDTVKGMQVFISFLFVVFQVALGMKNNIGSSCYKFSVFNTITKNWRS